MILLRSRTLTVCGQRLRLRLKTRDWLREVRDEIELCTANTVPLCDAGAAADSANDDDDTDDDDAAGDGDDELSEANVAGDRHAEAYSYGK